MAITLAGATASCSAADSAELGEAAAGQGGDAMAAGAGGGSTLADSSGAMAGAPSNGGAEGEAAVETGSDAIWSAQSQGFTLTAVGGMTSRNDTFAYEAETRVLERTCLSFCYENGDRITPSEPMVTSATLSEAQAAELTAALDALTSTHESTWMVDGPRISLTVALGDGSALSYVDNSYESYDEGYCSDATADSACIDYTALFALTSLLEQDLQP